MSYSFYGAQLAVKVQPNDSLVEYLRECVKKTPMHDSPIDLRGFYQPLAERLKEAVSRADYGYWDFIPDAPRGENTFDEWVSEIEGSLKEPVELADPMRGADGDRYFLITLIFLLLHGSNSHQTAAERCDLQETDFFVRRTFRMLFETIPMFTFATVKAAAVYLVPSKYELGLSLQDLQGEGYEYLRPLSGE